MAERKKAEILARIAENGQRGITEYDWDAARFFFEDLVAKKMEKGYGGFWFRTAPNIEEILSAIWSYACKPRAERVDNLEIEFSEGVKISEKPVRDFLNKHPECKERISYTASSGTVDEIILKSRSHYLLDTVKKTGKLAFVAADIVGTRDRESLSKALQKAARNGLKELIVPKEALFDFYRETFLKAVNDMVLLVPKNRSVKVTSEDPGVIDLLLEKLGNDNVRNDFFIKDTATSCHSTRREQFLADCYDKLKDEIRKNHDNKVFEVSGHNLAADKVNDICSYMNQDNRHGHLCLNFDQQTCADAVKHILKEGVKRSWILKCKASFSLDDMVNEMTNGWALNCSPSSKTETDVLFFPKNAEDALHKKMFEIFKHEFSEADDAYFISEQYWRLGIKPILEAVDDPESKISHLDFVVHKKEDEDLLELLSDEFKTFCKTTRAGRPGAWDIRVFSASRCGKFDEFQNSLGKNRLADDRKRILTCIQEKNTIFKQYKESFYAEITMPSAEAFFSSEIVQKKEPNEAIGRSDSRLNGLSIGNALRYPNLPEVSIVSCLS